MICCECFFHTMKVSQRLKVASVRVARPDYDLLVCESQRRADPWVRIMDRSVYC